MPSMIRKTEPGDVIGRCRIIRELGRGGVGTVYLARHETLQIEVALKILSPSLSLDHPALAERFVREAQIAARIRHPNVIAVMDAAHDETTGLYFIVQEYVGGGSLAWHLRHGPLAERRALEIITGIAQALIVAGENQIVHRDIKPENILLDLRGTAKLADLGLARQAVDSSVSLTLGGSFIGTPAYMSPEQARDAKAADARDDIYSLGATFYECLTGEPPFTGETPYNIMSELLTKPSPRPRARRPELSRSVDLVCRKMMAKTRGLRYADARLLIEDLHHCGVVTDAGLDGLHAATFEEDSITAHREARDLGVHDGAAAIPEVPAAARRLPSPGADYATVRAAVLLIALVTAATLLFAWMAPPQGWSTTLFSRGQEKKPLAAQPEKPAAREETPHPAADSSNSGPAVFSTAPDMAPAVPPETNLPPASPLPAPPQSAFQAREVAEKSLPPGLLGSAGRAPLLRVRGKREEGQLTPTLWTYDFFDPKAAGHARIVSVREGRVVDNGERVTYFISPYTPANILPEDLIDSTQALQIAQQLVPAMAVTGSQFMLNQEKNSAPFWTVRLWAKNSQGGEVELGSVVILAEKGDVISNTLKPDRLKD